MSILLPNSGLIVGENPGGGSPVIPGSPNSIVFINGAGTNYTTDANLTAGALDAFQRPGIHDFRLGPTNRGAVYKLGQWGADGDPNNIYSEGYICYGNGPTGTPIDGSNGSLGFYEPNGFGQYAIIPGVRGGNTFPICAFEDESVNAPFGVLGLEINDNLGNFVFAVRRQTNSETQARLIRNGVDAAGNNGRYWTVGNGLPEGSINGTVGDLFTQQDAVGGPSLWTKMLGTATNTGWGAPVVMNADSTIRGQIFSGMTNAGAVPTGKLHGSNAGIQYSTDITNRAQTRYNAYGTVAGNAPGITTFRSRGTTLGSTAALVAGDILGRWTTIGIPADGVSLNLASLLSFYADSIPAGAFIPTRMELELVDNTLARRLALKVTPDGQFSSRGPLGPGDGTATGTNNPSLWRTGTGSPNGVITGNPGDLYTDKNGGASVTLYVKESGVATNTGWVAK
jgi:hypothetical protein